MVIKPTAATFAAVGSNGQSEQVADLRPLPAVAFCVSVASAIVCQVMCPTVDQHKTRIHPTRVGCMR